MGRQFGITDCRNHKADTVEILDFAPCTWQLTGAVDRDIYITAQ